VQLYREGPNDKVFTFLEVEQFDRDVVIGDAGDVQELSYLSNQKMSKLINCEKQATEYALIKSQRPNLTIRFPQVSPYTVGQFIYFFEVATSYMGEMLGINTYDQPAVELGKIATFALMGHKNYSSQKNEIEAVCKVDNNFLL
jgi:glucose-6-phosphate isomerase